MTVLNCIIADFYFDIVFFVNNAIFYTFITRFIARNKSIFPIIIEIINSFDCMLNQITRLE
jgi:hypothetical protein